MLFSARSFLQNMADAETNIILLNSSQHWAILNILPVFLSFEFSVIDKVLWNGSWSIIMIFQVHRMPLNALEEDGSQENESNDAGNDHDVRDLQEPYLFIRFRFGLNPILAL